MFTYGSLCLETRSFNDREQGRIKAEEMKFLRTIAGKIQLATVRNKCGHQKGGMNA